MKGPPAYLTTDWGKARESIQKIKDLKPELAILSHGKPICGEELTRHLDMLLTNFNDIAVPDQGRFVNN